MKIIIKENRKIGDINSCYVIMDVLVNHNENFETVGKLILAAAESGADTIKFQTHTAEKCISSNSPI